MLFAATITAAEAVALATAIGSLLAAGAAWAGHLLARRKVAAEAQKLAADAQQAAVAAIAEVVDNLHTEIARLRDENAELRKEVERLRLRVETLTTTLLGFGHAVPPEG